MLIVGSLENTGNVKMIITILLSTDDLYNSQLILRVGFFPVLKYLYKYI